MALINRTTRELTSKIVYYGPGLGGKTSNIKFVYDNMDESQRGQLLTLSTDADRTIFFDFLPLELGTVQGHKVRVQLYTVPGQVFYEDTRRKVLKGADGVIFVADSQRRMREANLQSLLQLHEHLRDNGLDPDSIPMVIQYNKRDLQDIMSLEELDRELNPSNRPFFEAIASEGVGVEDTLKSITSLVLRALLAQPLPGVPRKEFPPSPVPRGGPWGELSADTAPEGGSLVGASDFHPENAGVGQKPGKPLDPLLASAVEDSAELLFEEGLSEDSPFGGAGASAATAEPATKSGNSGESATPGGPSREALAGIRLLPGVPLDIPVELDGRRYRLRLSLDLDG
jgi:signal recognition particle receptor subunit beta